MTPCFFGISHATHTADVALHDNHIPGKLTPVDEHRDKRANTPDIVVLNKTPDIFCDFIPVESKHEMLRFHI